MALAFAPRTSSRKPAPATRAAKRRLARMPLRAAVGRTALAPGPSLALSSTTPTIQAKLEIGRPNDRFEQEADRVAEEVLRTPTTTATTTAAPAGAKVATPSVQRLCSECEEKLQRQLAENEEEEELLQAKTAGREGPLLTPEIESGIDTVLTGSGRPLPARLRAYFEPRFGHDFGGVRIHTGRDAAKSAQLLNAQAYTVGRHIVFGEERYAPATDGGRGLLAHELTHTIQQGNAGRLSTANFEDDTGRGQPLATPEAKEKGEEEDPEAKIKSRPVISFSVVAGDRAPPVGVEGKRQACPAAGPAAQRHRELDATAAQIGGMGACTWGITTPDPLGIATETCRAGANWRLVVTRVNSVIRAHSRLLAGQTEPIPGVNTTDGNFCNQVTELDNLGTCAGAWYMIRAVRAHEDVHVDEWRDNFTADWTPLETAIEALTVPAAGATADRAAATAALRSDATFTGARDTSRGGGNFATFWGIADPNANTNAAETAVVTPRIGWICRHAGWQGWDPSTCPVCVAHGLA
jgi:Domain of unknown function (DUF4157)